jgi:hypothetical protein
MNRSASSPRMKASIESPSGVIGGRPHVRDGVDDHREPPKRPNSERNLDVFV